MSWVEGVTVDCRLNQADKLAPGYSQHDNHTHYRNMACTALYRQF